MAQIFLRPSVTIVDEWGIEASSAFYAQAADSNTVAAMMAEINAWALAIDGVTAGYLKGLRVTLFPGLPTGVKTAALSGSRVEQTGLLGFGVSGSTHRYTANVPAISNGATVLSGDRIVLTALDPVGLLITILTTVGTVLKWCCEHNEQILSFIDAMVGFHKKRKQLQRSSFEV